MLQVSVVLFKVGVIVQGKKCRICKQFIDIQGEDYLVQSKGFYHIMCWAEEKYATQKKNVKTLEAFITSATQKGIESRAKVQEKLREEATKKQLIDFISTTYNIIDFPTYFYIKINEVITGTRKGLMRPIPVEDLFDMWKRSMPKLEKINAQNLAVGKNIQGLNRIYYDIGVLVGEYDSYLKWKQKQSYAEPIIEEVVEIQKPYVKSVLYQVHPSAREDELNIYDLLDEI